VAQLKALGAFCKRIVLYCTVSLQNSRERLEIGRYGGSSRFSPKIIVTFRLVSTARLPSINQILQ